MTLCTQIEIVNNCYSNNPNIVNVNTNNVPFVNNDASYAFYNCNAIKNVYNLNSNITNMSHAFEVTTKSRTYYLYGENLNLPSSLQDASYIFKNRVNWAGNDNKATLPDYIVNAAYAFAECVNLKGVICNMYNCSNMCGMFYGVTNGSYGPSSFPEYHFSQALDVDMSYMFYDCRVMQYAKGTLPANVTNMAYTFWNTNLTTNITLSNKIVNMCNCYYKTHITTIPVLPDSVEDISYCFYDCQYVATEMVTIPQNVVNASWAFTWVNKVNSFNFQSSRLTDISHFYANFWNDYPVKQLRSVQGFLPDTLKNMSYAFTNARLLTDFCGSNTAEGCIIPNSVEDMSCCFDLCYNLSGTFYLPGNLMNGYQVFYGGASNNSVNLNVYGTLNNPVDLHEMFRGRSQGNNYINLTISLNNLTNIFRMFDTARFTGEITFTGQSEEGISLDAGRIFYNCQNVTTFPNGLGEANISSLGEAFFNAKNLTGNIYLKSTQISNVTNCFYNTTKSKNVYIPFTYINGVNTVTYNTFKAVYGGGANGVTLLNYTALYE